jgi:chaperonin GroES
MDNRRIDFCGTSYRENILSLPKPINDRIIVKPITEDVTPGGIIIPDSFKPKRTYRGTVVAVGPGGYDRDGKYITMTAKVGDVVHHTNFTAIEWESEKYSVICQDDVLAVEEKGND